MKYEYRVLYQIPLEMNDNNDPSTWRKVFYFSVYDCPSKLDLYVKVRDLIKIYNMDTKYIKIQKLDANGEYELWIDKFENL